MFPNNSCPIGSILGIQNGHISNSQVANFSVRFFYNLHTLSLNKSLCYVYIVLIQTLRCNCQGLTLIALLIPTVDTTYSDVVFIVCHKASYCDTIRSDVQRSSIWGLGSIAGNVNEVEISTVYTTQFPVYSDNLSSTDIFCEVNTGEGRDRGWT